VIDRRTRTTVIKDPDDAGPAHEEFALAAHDR
jgi:hypothetical protein